MKIAVLSGKGGTGKTFVSVNLACVAQRAFYADCDVEEPNGHLFLKPRIERRKEIKVLIPKIDTDKCNGCRVCVDFCKYNALAYVRDQLILFKEICHSCGGCTILCPQKALSEIEKEVGVFEEGTSEGVRVFTGTLKTGEVSGVPIIKEIIKALPAQGTSVIDCPPGSACVVMESIREADFCVLVAEPTLFGSHNLAMVYELVKLFDKPFGAVLNKCLEGENPSERFCLENNINILARIPFDEELGSLTSNGLIAAREDERFFELFKTLLGNISREVPL